MNGHQIYIFDTQFETFKIKLDTALSFWDQSEHYQIEMTFTLNYRLS